MVKKVSTYNNLIISLSCQILNHQNIRRSLSKIKVHLEVEKGMPMAFNIVEVFHFEIFIFIIGANCTLNVCRRFNDMV
jgi:hypothetical protein